MMKTLHCGGVSRAPSICESHCRKAEKLPKQKCPSNLQPISYRHLRVRELPLVGGLCTKSPTICFVACDSRRKHKAWGASPRFLRTNKRGRSPRQRAKARKFHAVTRFHGLR